MYFNEKTYSICTDLVIRSVWWEKIGFSAIRDRTADIYFYGGHTFNRYLFFLIGHEHHTDFIKYDTALSRLYIITIPTPWRSFRGLIGPTSSPSPSPPRPQPPSLPPASPSSSPSSLRYRRHHRSSAAIIGRYRDGTGPYKGGIVPV